MRGKREYGYAGSSVVVKEVPDGNRPDGKLRIRDITLDGVRRIHLNEDVEIFKEFDFISEVLYLLFNVL